VGEVWSGMPPQALSDMTIKSELSN
jgi:hypothetical protein